MTVRVECSAEFESERDGQEVAEASEPNLKSSKTASGEAACVPPAMMSPSG